MINRDQETAVLELGARRADLESAAATAAANRYDQALLTAQQAADEATVSLDTIQRAYQHGHLRVIRYGRHKGRVRIRRADLIAWLEAGGKTGR